MELESVDPEITLQQEAAAAAEAFRAGKVDIARLCGLEDDEVESAYQRGRQMLESGLVEQAAKVLTGVAIMRPTEPRYCRTLAFTYARLQAWQTAFALFGVVLTLDPKDSISALMQAECGASCFDSALARSLLVEALDNSPHTEAEKPYELRAQALLKMIDSQVK